MIYNLFLKKLLFFFRNYRVIILGKIHYTLPIFFKNLNKHHELKFIGKHGVSSIPYDFKFNYKKSEINVFLDEKNDFPYVEFESKKLYFPKEYDFTKIVNLYYSLLVEQDPESPHRYIKNPQELKGYTLFDVGAAEGIFSLSVIEQVDHLFLLECESYWIQPLKLTFANWLEKTTIINKFVGNSNNSNIVKLDSLIEVTPTNKIFVKIDVEGNELNALEGMRETLGKEKNIRLAVCTYHKPSDKKELTKFLSQFGFNIEYTKGFLYFKNNLNTALLCAQNF